MKSNAHTLTVTGSKIATLWIHSLFIFSLLIFSASSSASSIISSGAVIGAALDATYSGRVITYDLYIENLDSVALTNITAPDDLDAVFGAGNYAITSAPNKVSGPGTVSVNASFDGSGTTGLITAGASLAAGEIAHFAWSVEVSTLSDQGYGVGIYSNQITASADSTSDLSDDGTNPDPNGNNDPTEVGENDPTVANLIESPRIGAAQSALLSGTQVTLDIYLENLGDAALSNLSLPDDLDAVFGAGNYSVTSVPSLINDPGSITVNAGFNGSGDTALISTGSLAVAAVAQIRIVVNVSSVTDQGSGLGVYSSQVTASAQSSGGTVTTDLSDDGSNPDANGDGLPFDINVRTGADDEGDATVFTIGEEPAIGIAINDTVTASSVTLDFYLENLGTTALSSLSLSNDLDAVFGTGNYSVSLAPVFIDNPSTITLNTAFDGSSDSALISSGSLAIADTAQIQIVVDVLRLSDQGFGSGIYQSQVTISGQAPSGGIATDNSDDGTDPDPNGNGDATESGENDATVITVAENAVLGVALNVAAATLSGIETVTFDYYLENLGNVSLNNLTLVNDLNTVFGTGNYFVFSRSLQSGSGTISLNNSYNGNTATNLLNAGSSSLDDSQSAQIRVVVYVTIASDQGFGTGNYQNQVTAFGDALSTATVNDLSDDGIEPDPNGNGDPTESGENDITAFTVGERIGVAKNATISGNSITLDYYLENFGTGNLGSISMTDNLDGLFGANNYTITSAPSFVDDPGTMLLNGSYDGSSDDFMFTTGSTLAAADTAHIQMIVSITALSNPQGLGIGSYSNQVTVYADGLGGTISDLSDSGTDPDPNGNSDPTEAGENDVTVVTFPFDSVVGVAKTATVSGTQVTFDFYLENFGASSAITLSLVDDLDGVFGAGNYTILSAPSLIVDPGTLVLDGGYDGSSSTGLLSSASTLNGGATAQIQMVVGVTSVISQGSGMGVYSNQASLTGYDASGLSITDLSDNNTDPDTTGDNDPTFAGQADPFIDGENDPTTFLIGDAVLGTALHSFVNGTQITYDYYFENLGDVDISAIAVTQDLYAVFGGSSMYSGFYWTVVQVPTLIDGSATMAPFSTFTGDAFNSTLLSGASLAVGESARIRFIINVDTANAGTGPFSVQFTASGESPIGAAVSDVSNDGIDADPNANGDPTEAGENDATIAIIGEESTIGVAKNATVVGSQVILDYYLENLGNVTLSNLSLADDLDAVLGAGNYTISSAPAFIDNPGTMTLNAGFDGSASSALITSGTLIAADTAQIQVVVNVTSLVDQGLGLGAYQNQVIVSATGPTATVTQDLSDSGTDPDPNGSGNPSDVGEAGVTQFSVANSEVGVAESVSSSNGSVIFDFYLENFGSTELSSCSLPLDLDAIFGAGNYTISAAPLLMSAPRNIFVNTAFDGVSDTALLSGSLSAGGLTEQVRVEVLLSKLIDQGSGIGVYSSQVTVSCTDPSTATLTDLSDDGTNPDPSGNGDPTEAGENDTTVFTVANTNPVANNDSITGIIEDSVNNTLSVLANDTDVDSGQPRTITNVGTPNQGGSVTIVASASLSYTPASNFDGVETFTYTISDGSGGSDTGTVMVTITPVNDAPNIISTAGTSATEDTQYSYTATVTDVDDNNNGTDLTWGLSNQPTGMAVSTTGVVTWTPDNGVATSGTVILTVADGGENSTVASTETFTIAVTAVNDAPTGSVTITGLAEEDQLLTAGNTLVDIDGIGTINYQWYRSGSAIASATNTTYTLGDSDVGNVITVTASYTDDGGTSESVTSNATSPVQNINDLPTGSVTISGSVIEDQTLTASNSLVDIDGLGTISYQWNRAGIAIASAITGTYTLDDIDVGATITVTASYIDGYGASESATSTPTVIVANVNDLPILVTNLGLTLNEGDVGFIDSTELQVSDIESASVDIRYTLSAIPVNGVLQISGMDLTIGDQFTQEKIDLGLLVYLHDGGESVADSFEFSVDDSTGGVISSTLFSFVIIAQNDIPVVSNLAGDAHTYRMSDPLLLIDSGIDSSISDVDSADFDGGSLIVSIPTNRDSSEDMLVINTTGSVSLSSAMTVGSMVLVDSVPIGSIAVNGTGSGTNDLIVSFDQVAGNAILSRVTSLIQSVGYQNSDTVAITENDRTVRLVVNDGDGGNSANADITITVIQNRVPTAIDSSISVTEDVTYDFASGNFGYSDLDADPLSQVQIISLPALGSLQLSGISVAVNDVILAADIANLTYAAGLNGNGLAYASFGYQVHDGTLYSDSANTMLVNITAVNDMPVISTTALTSTAEDSGYSYTFAASDVDVGDSLTYSAPTLPSWLNFDSASGLLNGTPVNSEVGNHNVTLRVNDGTVNVDQSFTITVSNTNDAPVITSSTVTSVNEDSGYNYTFAASDMDIGDSLTYSAPTLPSWLNFDSASGLLSGMPVNSDVGNHNVTLRVNDGTVDVDQSFTITVSNTNDAPVITSSTVTSVNEDSGYNYTFAASDMDVGDSLAYSAPTLPSWLNFNSTSGLLSGTPINSEVGNHNVTLRVNDGTVDVDQSFIIEVTNTNDAPVVIGTPITNAIENIEITFTVTATDDDAGDNITYIISNNPAWLTIDAQSGVVSGIPRNGDIGTVSNVSVGASDGIVSTYLPSFNMTVFGDLDGDGRPDHLDPDIDGDGMDNDFERDHGLDPKNAADADDDLDNDGVSNIDEHNAGTKLDTDDYAPAVIAPDDITVNATGLFTKVVSLGVATAVDGLDGVLTPIADVGNHFSPGKNIVVWSVSDAAGNTGSAEQLVNVIPMVGFSKDQTVSEDVGTVTVKVILNGEAVDYPVEIPYTLSGTATADVDHDAVAGTATINSGTEVSIHFNVVNDGITGEPVESVIFSLGSPVDDRAIAGSKDTHTVEVVEGNVAPQVTLSATQSGVITRIVSQGSADVVVTATIIDTNTADTHSYDWSRTDNSVNDIDLVENNATFIFTPTTVGLVTVRLTVSDGTEQDSSRIFINVVPTPQLPVLGNDDTDGDGIDDISEGLGDDDNDGIPNYLDHVGAASNTLPEKTANNNGFIIESEPGVILRLGNVAFQSSYDDVAVKGDASVAGDGISNYGNGVGENEDDNFTYTGGRFDFIVDGLPLAGQSVNVVIPQFSAIPSSALYRKLMPSGWRNFVVNEKNNVYSAPGELGYCPPTGDNAYQLGLTEGHWCVQLQIEDGGPNDADGIADNTVTDPGGVAQLSNIDVDVNGGGGSMGLSIIMMLLLTVLYRLRSSVLLFLALFIVASPANAWYVSGSIGNASGTDSEKNLNQQLAAEGLDSTSSNVKKNRLGWKMLIGQPLDEVLSVEASYVDLGNVDVKISGSATDIQDFFDSISNIHPATASGINIGFSWKIYHQYKYQVDIRTGVFIWDADYQLSSSVGSRKINAHGEDISFGLGLTKEITPELSWRTDIDHYNIEEERINVWSIGLKYSIQ